MTARGWEDLSKILYLYEEDRLNVNENLVGQYIQNEKAVREFTAYYDLYNKYKETYRADQILKGNMPAESIEKAKAAQVDERFALEGLLIDKVKLIIRRVVQRSTTLKSLVPVLREVKASGNSLILLSSEKEKTQEQYNSRLKANALTAGDKLMLKSKLLLLDEFIDAIKDVPEGDDMNQRALNLYNEKVAELKLQAKEATDAIDNMFIFISKAFGDESNEMLVGVTELTIDNAAAEFLATFGSGEYERYNGILMVSDREKTLRSDIEKLL